MEGKNTGLERFFGLTDDDEAFIFRTLVAMENGGFFRFAQGQGRTFKPEVVGVKRGRQPVSLNNKS